MGNCISFFNFVIVLNLRSPSYFFSSRKAFESNFLWKISREFKDASSHIVPRSWTRLQNVYKMNWCSSNGILPSNLNQSHLGFAHFLVPSLEAFLLVSSYKHEITYVQYEFLSIFTILYNDYYMRWWNKRGPKRRESVKSFYWKKEF